MPNGCTGSQREIRMFWAMLDWAVALDIDCDGEDSGLWVSVQGR